MSLSTSDNLSVKDVRRSLSFEESIAVSGDGNNHKVTDQDDHMSAEQIPTEIQLKNDCENIWKELNNTHARLDARSKNLNTPYPGEEEFDASKVLERVLKIKEMNLQTELIAVENQGLQVTSTDPNYTDAHLKNELLTSIKQLEETLQLIKGQHKQVEDHLKREKELLQQHQEVKKSLQIKTDRLEKEKENIQGATSQVKELERKKKAADAYFVEIMKKLGSFLAENYPLPTPDNLKGSKTRVRLDPNVRYISLQKLTEDLMNISYIRPHDPYIRIKESHWPPYIELLLRCGIAQRHPQDCNLIRLVAFN
ncbi:centromere protein K-like [Stylophora pistillata]|uniref:centromere protein K-like n=1 Tax=Stylophora pistillata TaxID=50429 RepID=UPI000C03FD72|nr:centromere protein K-like [Stylophora pistillata]XP_022783486.1 centromere protein K-like [Stylophora pistillata]XP_022783487.1 centromere protein K-like [Stylophora pistillata]